ncbi:hypothetical protein JCM3774_001012 [Rhodotorula dairenensis]
MTGSAPVSIPPSANTSPSLAAAIAPGTTAAAAAAAADSSASAHHLGRAVPQPLAKAVQLRHHADALLQSPQLRNPAPPGAGAGGPHVDRAIDLLDQVIHAAQLCLDPASNYRLSDEHRARAAFCLGWATARRAQLAQPTAAEAADLPHRIQLALEYLELATSLLPDWFPPHTLPRLATTPSVTRPTDPNRHHASVDGWPLVPAWAAELVAELARTRTILAVAKAMSIQQQQQQHQSRGSDSTTSASPDAEDERQLAELIDLACRSNVQALFTPVDPHSNPDDATADPGSSAAVAAAATLDRLHGGGGGGNTSLADASTVLGNARLLRDVLSALVPYTTSPTEWKLRLEWATHLADVQFVSASLSANRLVDVASAEAAKLQRSRISPHERTRVKRVLERTARRMAPFEMRQGNVLLWLGRVMLDAVGALYLGRTNEGFQAERRRREQHAAARRQQGQQMDRDDDNGGGGGGDADDEDDDEPEPVPVPENDLVRETRQVLIRAAALFENAYASIVRAPVSARRRRLELRVLRRLEATYCDLEHLDNTSSAEVIELRAQRIERAVLINERLISLGDGASTGDRSTRNGRGRGASGLDEDEMDESDREQAAEDEDEEPDLDSDSDDDDEEDDSEDEHERLTKALGRTRLS